MRSKRGFLNKRLLEKVRGSIKEDNELPSSALNRFVIFPYSGASDLHSIPLSGCGHTVDFFL
jgi:hypothetical protein